MSPVSSEIFLENDLYPHVIALDGQISRERTCFTLDTEKFYRFFVQSDTPASHLFVKVYEKGEVIHTEKIPLPLKNTLAWERYLTTDGMVFIPETILKAKFGIDLYITIVPDPTSHFSIVIAQKGVFSGYRFSVSLDDSYILYKCHLTEPPPWQLGMLSKPALPSLDRSLGKSSSRALPISKEKEEFKTTDFPILDQFVEELKQDPFLLAGYVYNEIALIDPFLYQENGVFCAPSIHRNACRTFLEKQGSVWEQCQFLVYLLQKAGYQASYAIGDCALPRAFLEKMLLTQLPKEQEVGLVQYPWVIFFDGKEWISLFPWMKEMQVQEGYELYGLLPEEYASADRWILRYLKSDEKIVKHIDPDGDDTAGVLFVRFVEEELRKKGLSLTDVGIHRTQLKKQYTSWEDFPRPISKEEPRVIENIKKEKNLFAYSIIEVYSRKNPEKKIIVTVPFTFLHCNALYIRFSPEEENTQRLHIELEDLQESMLLDVDDHYIDIKVNYVAPIGFRSFQHQSTLSMVTGTTAALCFHFGGASTKITSQFYTQFTEEKEENKRLHALLSFIGAAYFEKCGCVEQKLAHLHKIGSINHLVFGLSKLSSDLASEKKLPQVDMLFVATPRLSSPTAQDMHSAMRQCRALGIVDASSNEHWILREVFQDPYAISTIKLLQIAHLEHQKKGLADTGFLTFSRSSLAAAENTPEAAQSIYFSHLRDLDLRHLKEIAGGQWNTGLFDPKNLLSDWAYAYMTPGLTSSQDGTYQEIGTLIFHPCTQYAFISNNTLLLHGGLGSSLPSYLTPVSISEWQLTPGRSSYTLQTPFQYTQFPSTSSIAGTTKWSPDVRLEHKSFWSHVSDSIDVVTGAFTIDEVDLFLPGSFPLEIRRNYNSQNPLLGDFGCGWKLGLNPDPYP